MRLPPSPLTNIGICRFTQVKVWRYEDVPAGSGSFLLLIELKGHRACIQDMKVRGGALDAHADVLISADRDGTVALWGFGETNASPNPLSFFHTGQANLMSIRVDETGLFTAGLDGHIKANRRLPACPGSLRPTAHRPPCCCRMQVWDAQGTLLFDHVCLTKEQRESGVTAIAVVPDHTDGVMVTACQDKAIKLWKMPTFAKRGIIGPKAGHTDVVRCIAKGPGNSFFTGSMDSSICVWEFPAC